MAEGNGLSWWGVSRVKKEREKSETQWFILRIKSTQCGSSTVMANVGSHKKGRKKSISDSRTEHKLKNK